MSSKGDAQAEAALKRLRKQEQNCICPNCGTYNQFGFGNICVKFKTFVCDNCKSSHQAISHRCKSVTMSTWTMEEVQQLTTQRGGGNLAASHTWLLHAPNFGERYNGGRRPQAGDKIEIFKQFIVDCYERQMFKSSTPFVPPEKQPHATPSPTPSTRRSSGPSKNGGLIKATKSSGPSTPAVDLLDMGSTPQNDGNTGGNADFFNQPMAASSDLFSSFPSSSTPQQQPGGAAFGANDLFSQPLHVPAATSQQQQQQQQDFFMQPQQQFDAFSQPMATPTASAMNAFQPQQPDQQNPQSVFQIQTTRTTQDTEFGGFESAAAPTKTKAEAGISSFGGLVDLGNLTSKSEDEAKKQAALTSASSMSMNSFSGLDGFSRSPSSGSIMGFSAMHGKPSAQQQPSMGLMTQQHQPPMMSNSMQSPSMMGGMTMMSQQPPMMNGGMMNGGMMNGGMMNGGMMNGGMMNNGLQQNYMQQQQHPPMMGGMNNGMSVNTMNFMPPTNMNNGSMGGLPSPASMKSQQYQQNMMTQQQKSNSFDGLRW